jgi:two-component system LytT family sensor kinase
MRRLWVWPAIAAGWTALALFFAVSASLTYRSTGRAANWTLSLERSLVEWWLWALLTPLVVWLARRFPLDHSWRRRAVTLHLAAGVAIALVKTAAERAALAWLTGFWIYWLASTIALQLTIYCAIVAAAHGVTYYERSRERDQLAARLADVKLQLLSMQLQPHFLFNTLNTIAELVHDDPDAADHMIAGLSDLLRKTLDLGPTQEIPLAAELELLGRYLAIQRARFGDRLRVEIVADADARTALVPVLLLQPLVENAIQHGLAERLSSGAIAIRATRDGSRLLVTVNDDGAGPEASGAAARERVGLGNTRARLDMLYGSDHRLVLSGGRDGGARTAIDIPFKPAVTV